MFVANWALSDLAFYGRAVAVLLILILSIFASASRIIRCASSEKIPSATMWTAALIVFVAGFVFVAGVLRIVTLPSLHW